MPRLFVANLSFEQQIAGDRRNLPLAAQRRADELAACWLPLCEPGDWIWCPAPFPESFWTGMQALGLPLVRGIGDAQAVPEGLELVPWGWSAEMRRFAPSVRASCDAPPDAAILRANSRRFSFDLETLWSAGLRGARAITSQADVAAALRTVGPAERWVIKSEFSSAARQRIVGTGPVLDPNAAAWVEKRLRSGEWLAFEPWVERIREAGLQWTVPRTGVPRLEGIAELLTGEGGNYLGSVFGLGEADIAIWEPAVEMQQRAVELIQHAGYVGPIGIDAMQYRDADGAQQLRPLQDINARWTMGRLALGWQRVLPTGVWRHGTVAEFTDRASEVRGVIRTSPEIVGDRPAQAAMWLESGSHVTSRDRQGAHHASSAP